jgi:hypothetical protein
MKKRLSTENVADMVRKILANKQEAVATNVG